MKLKNIIFTFLLLTVQFTVAIDVNAQIQPTVIQNTASVKTVTPDPDMSNNTAKTNDKLCYHKNDICNISSSIQVITINQSNETKPDQPKQNNFSLSISGSDIVIQIAKKNDATSNANNNSNFSSKTLTSNSNNSEIQSNTDSNIDNKVFNFGFIKLARTGGYRLEINLGVFVFLFIFLIWYIVFREDKEDKDLGETKLQD